MNPRTPKRQSRKENAVLLFIDTETNGLPRDWRLAPAADLSNWPRLVEVAWAIGNEFVSRASKPLTGYSTATFLIRPDRWRMSPQAESVHRISIDECYRYGAELHTVLMALAEAVAVHQVDTIVAHNADFDLAVLAAEYLRTGMQNPLVGLDVVCTMRASTDYCQIRGSGRGYKWPRLEELYRRLFERQVVEAHRAEQDVLTLIECYWGLFQAGVLK
jgi:DNA polymerase III subunit epsilon